MKLKLNKKGMSLPAMLAIITFLIGSLLAIITTTINRAELIERSIDSSEEYVNYVNNIKAIQSIIVRDEITDQTEIANLASYFNIQYDQPNPAIYRFYRELDSVNRSVSGYLATNTEVIETYDEIFQYTGTEETFELSPLINATTMLKEYTFEYIPEHFPGTPLDGDFTTFDGIVNYYESLSGYSKEMSTFITNQVNPIITDYIFINGDVYLDNKNLTIDSGLLLIIDGNLTTNGSVNVTGNIVVNGDFNIVGKNRETRNFIGTFYINGDVNIAQATNIGSEDRPAFFIANGNVYLDNKITIYGYFIANDFSGQQGNNFITGGVYTTEEPQVNDKNLEPNTLMTEDDLKEYGVTTTIIVESTTGEITFTYTEPKFE